MNEISTYRNWPEPEEATPGGALLGESPVPRIQIDVPMGTPYYEIQETIFRQAYELAGTHLRAAIALGITPETISRVLRKSDRRQAESQTTRYQAGGHNGLSLEQRVPVNRGEHLKPRPAELKAQAVAAIRRLSAARRAFLETEGYYTSSDLCEQDDAMTDN